MLGVNALVYIDDVSLYAKDPQALVDANAMFHDLIGRANVKVKLRKATRYTEQARWLGLVLSRDGITQDDRASAGSPR
jgi:hypothetical protein